MNQPGNVMSDFLCDISSPTTGKESACQCRRPRRPGFDPCIEKIPWRRKWQPTPVFLPGESHGQSSLAGYSPWGLNGSRLRIISPRRFPFLLIMSGNLGPWAQHEPAQKGECSSGAFSVAGTVFFSFFLFFVLLYDYASI